MIVMQHRVLGARQGTASDRRSSAPQPGCPVGDQEAAEQMQAIGSSPNILSMQGREDSHPWPEGLHAMQQVPSFVADAKGASRTRSSGGALLPSHRPTGVPGEPSAGPLHQPRGGPSSGTFAAILAELDGDSEPSTPNITPPRGFNAPPLISRMAAPERQGGLQRNAAETLADILSELDDDEGAGTDLEGFSGTAAGGAVVERSRRSPNPAALRRGAPGSRGCSPTPTSGRVAASSPPLCRAITSPATSHVSPLPHHPGRQLPGQDARTPERPRTGDTVSPYRRSNSLAETTDRLRPSTASPLKQSTGARGRMDPGIARLEPIMAGSRSLRNAGFPLQLGARDDDDGPPLTVRAASTQGSQRPSSVAMTPQQVAHPRMMHRSNTSTAAASVESRTAPDLRYCSPVVEHRQRAAQVVAAARRASGSSNTEAAIFMMSQRIQSLSASHPPANPSPMRSTLVPRSGSHASVPNASPWRAARQQLHDLPTSTSLQDSFTFSVGSSPMRRTPAVVPQVQGADDTAFPGFDHRSRGHSPVRLLSFAMPRVQSAGPQLVHASPNRPSRSPMRAAAPPSRVGCSQDEAGEGQRRHSFCRDHSSSGGAGQRMDSYGASPLVGQVQKLQVRQKHMRARQSTAPGERGPLK